MRSARLRCMSKGDATVTLAAGEFASWKLGQGPGRFRVAMQGFGAGGIEGSLVFVSDHANCATEMSDRSTLHCVVYEGERGTVMVRALKPLAAIARVDRMRADL